MRVRAGAKVGKIRHEIRAAIMLRSRTRASDADIRVSRAVANTLGRASDADVGANGGILSTAGRSTNDGDNESSDQL